MPATDKKPIVVLLTAHPAQVLMLAPVAEALRTDCDVVWLIRDKDRSSELATALGIAHTVVSCASSGLIGNACEFLADTLRVMRLLRRHRASLIVTKFGAGNIAGRLVGVPSLSFNDDDVDIVPLIAMTSYPFARAILAPAVTRMGKYDNKTIRYNGFHELLYLHPNRFSPDPTIVRDLHLQAGARYAIVRLSALTAHHDQGVQGVSSDLLRKVINQLPADITVFISSEKPLPPEFERYRIPIAVDRMHHALAGATVVLGDSQTMTAEAAVLGTPAIRYNNFVGRISYLEKLQDYELAFGFKPGEEERLLTALGRILNDTNDPHTFAIRRRRMLDDCVDPVTVFAKTIRACLNPSVGATMPST